MKKIISTLFVLGAVSASASTLEEARELYASRGDDAKNALKAAQIYKSLADTRSTNKEKAQMKIEEANSLFYYGGNYLTKKKEKLANYVKAYEAADVAVQAMNGAKTPEDKAVLAEALYSYSANLGKWGETKGVIRSLTKWPELKRKSFAIVEADESVKSYGAYRILGKGFIKVPTENSEQGYKYLKKGYESSIIDVNGVDSSSNVANLTYLVWASHKLEKTDDFCEYYQNTEELQMMTEEDSSVLPTFYPNLIPETQSEIEETMDNEDYQEFFEENC